MTILLHACCGPCSVAVSQSLAKQNIKYSAYFYNPNIHPYTEYQRRLDTMRLFAFEEGIDLAVEPGYRPEEYFAELTDFSETGCLVCYRIRLQKTAAWAKENGFEAFTTTLLYSRYQKHDEIRQIGQRIGEESGIPFHYEDFRVLWKEGIRESKRRGMYRQQYCGCLFSERERFMPPEAAVSEAGPAGPPSERDDPHRHRSG